MAVINSVTIKTVQLTSVAQIYKIQQEVNQTITYDLFFII